MTTPPASSSYKPREHVAFAERHDAARGGVEAVVVVDQAHFRAQGCGQRAKCAVGRVGGPEVRLVNDEIGGPEEGDELGIEGGIGGVAQPSSPGFHEQRARRHVVQRAAREQPKGPDAGLAGPAQRNVLEIVVEGALPEALPVPERAHAGHESLLPDDAPELGRGDELQALAFDEVLVEAHALEAVHVIAVRVRDQHVVDASQGKRAARAPSSGGQRRAIAVGAVDRELKAVAAEQERRRVVTLREGVAHTDDHDFEASHGPRAGLRPCRARLPRPSPWE